MKCNLCILVTLLLLTWSCERDVPEVTPGAEDIALAEQRAAELRAEADQLTAEAEVAARSAQTVVVPAGSNNALAAAIAAAGDGGTVLLKAGEHTESGTVEITHRVRLVGEAGAVLRSGVRPLREAGYIQPALHVYGADGGSIVGLEIRFTAASGGTAILLEQAPRTFVQNNRIVDFEFGILLEDSPRSFLDGNHLTGSSDWLNGLGQVYGIININGKDVRMLGNVVDNTFFGIWPCDEGGLAISNETHNNFIGFILCKVPDQALPLPKGNLTGSQNPSYGWLVHSHEANDNLNVGILVIDGAHHNLLVQNRAANNGLYNMELVGDSFRFGFLTPKSHDNRVISYPDLRIKDCGENNTIIGGELVDNSLEPCF